MATHSRTGNLILPSSHASSLQIYSPSSSNLISELEVAPSNRVSKRDDKPLVHAFVCLVSTSNDGSWMATVDLRQDDDDPSFGMEIVMKLWKWEGGNWLLNTRIERPHGAEMVHSLEFSPTFVDGVSPLLLSTGADGNVKTWRVRTVKDKKGVTDGP